MSSTLFCNYNDFCLILNFSFFLAIFFIFDIKKSIYLKIDVFPLILSNMLVFMSGVLGHSLALIKFYFNLKNEILVNLSESLYIIYICDPYVLSSILIFLFTSVFWRDLFMRASASLIIFL